MVANINIGPGNPLLPGASPVAGGVNFAIFVRNCKTISLLLFEPGTERPVREIELDPHINRTGDVWHIMVEGAISGYSYAYRLCKSKGEKRIGRQLGLDPYARSLSGGEQWGQPHVWRGKIVNDEFDWQGDRPLGHHLKDTIIYELHVRGFTRHHSAGVQQSGTYLGLIDKIPYLKELGITALELLPITEFDENDNLYRDPISGERLKNFWGYSPLSFFAPKAAYASVPTEAAREFKTMVRELHKAEIEVLLDMVFNHTGGAHAESPAASFKAMAKDIYYMQDPETGGHMNFSGCGNTLNCNHPVVRQLIIDCLRYWVVVMHVDGFRFDLASIFSRGQDGEVLRDPPLVEEIAADPILAKTKLIAEAWDAAAIYQVGSFSDNPRWSEWNGRFRDDVRGFLCGHAGSVSKLATRLAGSSDLYENSGRRPFNSINFVTSHDGFTLQDLVSYNHKHNEANGEDNRDGENHNLSWNSGREGNSHARKIVAMRDRRMRTAALILMLSQGTPMLTAGDEFGRSQRGNNNAYCQDNEISWLNWDLARENAGLWRFFKYLIRLRKKHAVFRRVDFFHPQDGEILWQGKKRGVEDWSPEGRLLCFLLSGKGRDNDFFVVLNGAPRSKLVELPELFTGRSWKIIVDTAEPSPHDISEDEKGLPVETGKIKVRSRIALVLIS